MCNTIWTIAGVDPTGTAGIQVDLKIFDRFGLHGCAVITAITAQNAQSVRDLAYTTPALITAQLQSLVSHLPAAIKIGMLGSAKMIEAVRTFLESFSPTVPVILDPILFASSGGALFEGDIDDYLAALKSLLPFVTCLTPNLPEAEKLLDRVIHSQAAIERAAHDLLALGAQSVLIKGGHGDNLDTCHDYFASGDQHFWLTSPRYPHNYRGTGCALSSSMAASLALGYSLIDAVVISKMTVNQGMRLGEIIDEQNAKLTLTGFPEDERDFPSLRFVMPAQAGIQSLRGVHCTTKQSSEDLKKFSGLPRSLRSLATTMDLDASLRWHDNLSGSSQESPFLYPIVDSLDWLEILLPLGITMIQLRLKNKTPNELNETIGKAVTLARKYQAKLFINDHWKLAIAHGADGVHLGQEDLQAAAVNQISKAGLGLGVSTHSYVEVARISSLHPSYIAIGPIFETQTKQLSFAPQGLAQLARWRRTLRCPLVAIGGIHFDNIAEVAATGVDGIAVISAITKAEDPIAAIKQLLAKLHT